MLSTVIWVSCLAIEIVLFVRLLRAKLAGRFPAFFFYITFVLTSDVISAAIVNNRNVYEHAYWITEFLGVVIGCGVVFEIYRVGLSSFPGTARMARNVLVGVFAVAVVKGLVTVAGDPSWWSQATARSVELPLRTVQATAIAALMATFLFYAVPFGKNLRGIVLGYGLFVCASVVSLSLSATGIVIPDRWAYLLPASYLLALGVWVTHLYSYEKSPVSDEEPRLEQEYQKLAAETRRRLRRARGYIAKAVRS